MASLMDVPFKRELVESLRAAGAQETPEQVEQRIKQAVADALSRPATTSRHASWT